MAALEGWTFAGTNWNDRTNFIMQEFDPGVAPKRWQWISGADSDGALPAEEAHYDNAEMTVRIRIAPQASMDTALTKIGTLVQALQEAEKQPLGSAGVWTPSNSTKSLTAYVVGGEVTGIPLANKGDDAGWFLRNPAPVITMKLYRRPFLYGSEVTSAATVTDSNPVQTFTFSSIPGDVAAEARLVVTDAATQNRRHVEWGIEQRYYNAATSLLIDSASLVTSGFAGTATTRTGAYSASGVIRATLASQASAVCGTGALSHVGSFRVKARVWPSTTNIQVRLAYQDGDGSFMAGVWVPVTGSSNFYELDLGVVNITPATLGTQKWQGRIDALTNVAGAGTDTLDVDYIVLIPVAEGYGKARASWAYSPGVLSARDEYETAGTAVLNARVAPSGGTWATSGATTDFTGSSGGGD